VSKQDVLDPTRNLERLVNLQKKATEILLQQIVLFEKRTKENYELKIIDTKTETLLQIKDIINEAIEDVNASFISLSYLTS